MEHGEAVGHAQNFAKKLEAKVDEYYKLTSPQDFDYKKALDKFNEATLEFNVYFKSLRKETRLKECKERDAGLGEYSRKTKALAFCIKKAKEQIEFDLSLELALTLIS